MATAGNRYFLVGETVHLRARVSVPGTRTPTDATVVLTSLRTGTTQITLTTTTFTRTAEGDYSLVIPTATLAVGQYDLVVTISNGPNAVSIVTDQFALRTV